MKSKKIDLITLLPEMDFVIAFIEGNQWNAFSLSLSDMLNANDNWEYLYAIHERMPDIITLKAGERMQMWFNRDNTKDSTGFIKRIK